MVSPEFFQTMGLRLMRGRGFAVTDVDGQPPVVIINERLASQFGDVDPIGRRINLGEWVTIVGVVSDVAPPVARRRAEAGGLPAVSRSSCCRTWAWWSAPTAPPAPWRRR